MTDYIQRELAKMRRSKQHILDHPVAPAILELTTETTGLTGTITRDIALDAT